VLSFFGLAGFRFTGAFPAEASIDPLFCPFSAGVSPSNYLGKFSSSNIAI
jgi:hypothetical protein